MAIRYRLKQHDLAPALEIQLSEDGAAVDLTNAMGARFIMKNRAGVKVNSPMAILDQTQHKGVVSYQWQLGDTDTVDVYSAEVEIMWPQSRPQTFPPYAYMQVQISADLG